MRRGGKGEWGVVDLRVLEVAPKVGDLARAAGLGELEVDPPHEDLLRGQPRQRLERLALWSEERGLRRARQGCRAGEEGGVSRRRRVGGGESEGVSRRG